MSFSNQLPPACALGGLVDHALAMLPEVPDAHQAGHDSETLQLLEEARSALWALRVRCMDRELSRRGPAR